MPDRLAPWLLLHVIGEGWLQAHRQEGRFNGFSAVKIYQLSPPDPERLNAATEQVLFMWVKPLELPRAQPSNAGAL